MDRQLDTRIDVYRNGVRFSELHAVGSPNITMNKTANIKTALKATFEPNDTINWLTDELRPILIIDGVEYPYGAFLPATVKRQSSEYGLLYDVEAYDRCWLVQTVRTETILHLASGTNYITAIKSLLTTAGIALVLETPTSSVLASAREDWDVGTDYLTIVNALLAEINYNSLWFDANGYAVLDPASIPDADHIDHVFDASNVKSMMLPELSAEADIFNAPNVFLAVCSNADYTTPLVATAENNNPNSELSIIKRGRRIAQVYKVDNIADQTALNAYAQLLCFEGMKTGEKITVSTAILPNFGVGDVVAVNHPDAFGICIETGWRIQFESGGTMTHTLEKVVFAT